MGDRKCRKCGKHIPNWIKIDGRDKSLQNRKFCLDCSPYKKHNTSPHDPITRRAREYGKYTEEQKETVKLSLYRRALQRKDKLIAKKGGVCKVCGYSLCRSALTFHHLDPGSKRFGLSLNNLWSKTWEEINEEAEKCDLLCSNCHREVEEGKNNIVDRVNLKYGTTF